MSHCLTCGADLWGKHIDSQRLSRRKADYESTLKDVVSYILKLLITATLVPYLFIRADRHDWVMIALDSFSIFMGITWAVVGLILALRRSSTQ